jgi:hypothetical protein
MEFELILKRNKNLLIEAYLYIVKRITVTTITLNKRAGN